MIRRYQTETINQIFSDENKFRTWFMVEVAYLEAYLERNNQCDEALIERLKKKSQSIDWTKFVAKVDAFEHEVRHDVIAFLQALEDELSDDARLIHLGLTSSDVVDTSWAILMKNSCEQIVQQLSRLLRVLFEKATLYRGVICLGRTHGQAAEPTTFGIKLLTHLCEFYRARERIIAAKSGISVGKFSGAVGVYTQTDPEVEKQALAKLGLEPETVATQVVARDRHAQVFSSLAILAGSIERIAVEIRLLMHGQVEEAFEPWSAKQKGSSAMPHKKNPILSENLTGLMRLLRSYAMAAFENQALWHERDISHSSVERVIVPDAFSVMDFALNRLVGLIENLTINKENMLKNLEPHADVLCSQAVMLALVKKGMSRKLAYEMVQQASFSNTGKSFSDNLRALGIGQYLSEEEILQSLTKNLHVAHEKLLFDRVERLLRQV